MIEEKLPIDFWDLLHQLCIIGSPTGQESRRARWLKAWFNEISPASACIDEDGNVLVDLSRGGGAVWLIDAHIDTVFPDQELSVLRGKNRWFCPGIYDNASACCLLMLLGRKLLKAAEVPPLLLCFSTGEEGFGNLGGLRGLLRRQKARITDAIILDMNLHEMTIGAVGSERYLLRWAGPGGHSWGGFGGSSVMGAMAHWIVNLQSLLPWRAEQLTYNLGKIEGGSGINVIASEVVVQLELRSVCPNLLAEALSAVRKNACQIASNQGVEVNFELLGSRAAGQVPFDWRGLNILRSIHQESKLPLREVRDSTNANAILEASIPGTCTGLSLGGQVHTRREWLDCSSVEMGWIKLQKIFLHIKSDENKECLRNIS